MNKILLTYLQDGKFFQKGYKFENIFQKEFKHI